MSDYNQEHSTEEVPEEVEKYAQEAVNNFQHELNEQPSAPPADDNGFIVVPQTDEPTANETNEINETNVVEEPVKPVTNTTTTTTTTKKTNTKSEQSCSGFKTCPYYFLGINCLSKVQIPPKVQDLVLWKNPKVSGAVLGSSLVLLLSLATFTLLSVASTLLLLALASVGVYRFYLTLLFRIKGTYDDTFDKLSSFDLSLPKDKVQELARLLDTDINKIANQFKSIVLWDNLASSSIAFFVTYLVYCVGSWFNTITLLILAIVAVFSLPKVYQIYQVQIDQTIQQATAFAHKTADDLMAKLPFLKKKVQ